MTTPGGPLFERVPKYKKPDYPPILTKKDWDKKKGVFAKFFSGKTGIGEQCLKVEKLHAAVKWNRLEMNEALRNNGFESWKSDDFTTANYKKLMDLARGEATGSMKTLSTELYKLRDLCKAAEKKFRADKKIPKASADHVKNMADVADKLGVAVNQHSVGDYLKRVDDALHGWLKDAVYKNMIDSKSTVPPELTKAFKSLSDTPTAKNLHAQSQSVIRRLNQAIGNMGKFGDRGWGAKNPAYASQFKVLEPYARGGGIAPDSASPDEINKIVAKIKVETDKALTLLAAFK